MNYSLVIFLAICLFGLCSGGPGNNNGRGNDNDHGNGNGNAGYGRDVEPTDDHDHAGGSGSGDDNDDDGQNSQNSPGNKGGNSGKNGNAGASKGKGPDGDQNWQNFKKRHGRSYDKTNDENERWSLYLNRTSFLAAHNNRRKNKEVDFGVAENAFTDYTEDELKKRRGFRKPQRATTKTSSTTTTTTTTTTMTTTELASTTTEDGGPTTAILSLHGHRQRVTTTTTRSTTRYTTTTKATTTTTAKASTTATIDWRTSGIVSPVLNQGQCGSCWAFSTAGAVESRYAKARNIAVIPLSPQNLVDCSSANSGCNGGDFEDAFDYVKAVQGLNTHAAYPYKATQGNCKINNNAGAKYGALATNDYADVPSGDENALLQALKGGPVAVAIDASLDRFNYYSDGIYSDPNCSQQKVNHGVLLVGYGIDAATSKPYWIIKNSWDTDWGEKGYARIKYGQNVCGIATAASYPVIK